MDPLTRRQALRTVGTASLALALAAPAGARSASTTDARLIAVNGQAFRGYWAAQRGADRAGGR